MEKNSLITYFTKDANWVQPFLVGSILIYLNFALNSLETNDVAVNLFAVAVSIFIGCVTQGFFALNTNSLINCKNGEIKLASFNNIGKLFVTGLKYICGAFVYGAGIGVTVALFTLISLLMGQFGAQFSIVPVIILFAIGIIFIIYLSWMLVYMSFAYSRFLSFRSMFEFSNFGKYRVGKYIACILIFILLLAFAVLFFGSIMKDAKTFKYFILILVAPATMLYSLILSKIQAESIQDAIAKENSKVVRAAGSIPNIKFKNGK